MDRSNSPALAISAWQVLQSMLDGVVLTDAHGIIMAVNDAFCAVTGYSRMEVIGRNSSLLRSGKHDRAFYGQMWGALRQRGSWQGEIWNRRKNGALYPEWLAISTIKDRWGRTLCYLGVSRDITNPKLNEERLMQLAQYDPLTCLPNRRLFDERLKRAISYHPAGRRLAVLFLDLDHFKDINDQWGHAAGDAFLQAVAARLRGCVRRTDTVARWAGDEFAVLLNPVSGQRDAARVARKILHILRRPFTVNGHRTKTSASIGACMLDGKASPELLIAKADRTMYSVKKGGRDDIRFWSAADSLRRSLLPTQRAGAAKAAQSDRKRRRPRQVGVRGTVFRE